MAGSDREHARRPLRWILGVVLVLALVVGGLATWHYDLLDRWLEDEPQQPAEPAAIAPPPGLDLPPVDLPEAVARPLPERPRLDRSAVRAAVQSDLSDRDLGRHVLAAVAPLAGGPPAYTLGSGLAVPASTTKVVTSAAALYALGADHVFETTVVQDGRRRVVLVGGGDPLLASRPDDETAYPPRADVVSLAERTARALRKKGIRSVRLGYDAGLFTGPAENPTWEPDYIPDGVVSPIAALWVDEGRPASGFGRVADPAAAAAAAFATALGKAGIRVEGAPEGASAPGSTPLAAVSSAPLGEIVERVLTVSDNEAAEVLLRHVGLAAEGDGSFDGGRRGVRRILESQGIDLRSSVLYDGSGLSRDNRLDPRVLIDVLRLAMDPEHPELGAVLTGLPVAGFTGSLADRMDLGPPEGRGRVRAKTGTLTGVTSLAGIAADVDGNAMVFVLMADRVRKNRDYFARVAMDNAAASLGACRCGL
ncbi:MAG TPA: D-alanyl-D-alanine carboxypeptidase/D-alanyl-D-alanine-endopeptidase [Nocardioides sp.]|nr:D-alanyl-D-alanine carboxypeptidase/D-alanyl-D-alanine-endopeptidase [Nocardioides sp.]